MVQRSGPSAWRRAWLLLSLLVAGACQRTWLSKHQRELIENHIVSFNDLGKPINPETDIEGWEIGDQVMTPQHYEERVRLIMNHARAWLVNGRGRKVLVFIHGGLNDYADSRDRILERAERMKEDGYYPIFVSWDSGLVGSYWDNLIFEDGEWSLFKLCMSPFAVARDLVVGILNIPPRATRSALDLLEPGEGPRERAAASVAQAHDAMNEPGHVAGKAKATDAERAAWEDRRRNVVDIDDLPHFQTSGFGGYYKYSAWSLHWLLVPVSVVTSLGFDAFGKGAWEGMIRRTKRLFDDEDISNIGSKGRHAGLSLLMQELGKLQASLNRTPPASRRTTSPRASSKPESKWFRTLIEWAFPRAAPPTGVFDPEVLHKDESQRGLAILRLGLRRFLDKINDSRYETEIHGIVNGIQGLPADEWGKLWIAITTRLRANADVLGSDDLKSVIETTLRLMYPGDAADLTELADALTAAFDDIDVAMARNPEHRRILQQLLPKGGRIDRESLELFVRALLDYVEMRLAAVQRNEAEVVIFAHSMGTIIVNEILRRSEWFPTPRFKDIVYMGAACSIREYEDSVFPYLRRNKSYLTQFHNLMLHPRAEEEEIVGWETIPRGSLLVYIDNYLTNPSTVRDRTLGRFANIMLSLDRTQAEVAGQIHMKVFSVGPGQDPQQPEGHGEFTPARFWEQSFFRTSRQVEQRRDSERKKRISATSPST